MVSVPTFIPLEMLMRLHWVGAAALTLSFAAAGATPQIIQPAPIPHRAGQGVTPSFEGWYRNADGSFSLSFGYFNRNYDEALDIPVGPGNRFEPGAPDRGQPTHFLPRRQTGLFTVVVPADFGTRKLTWTLVANGQINAIPGHLRPEWEIDALREATSGNTPPVIRFHPDGPSGQGPGGVTSALEAAPRQPVTLAVWATDDHVRKREAEGQKGPGLGVVWSRYRGPDSVTLGEPAPALDGGRAATTVSFAAPGEYVLRVLAWDASGPQGTIMAGGFQCCWTNGYVRVKVSDAASTGR